MACIIGNSVSLHHPRRQPACSTGRRSFGAQTARRSSHVAAASDGFCRDKISSPKDQTTTNGQTYKLTFIGAGGETKEVTARDNQYILDAAEAHGLDLPATCRGGICGSCVARVTSGTTDHSDIDDLSFTVSEDEQAQGMTLLCMTRACSDLTIETQSDWGYSLGVGEWKGATGRFSASPEPLMSKDKWGAEAGSKSN